MFDIRNFDAAKRSMLDVRYLMLGVSRCVVFGIFLSFLCLLFDVYCLFTVVLFHVPFFFRVETFDVGCSVFFKRLVCALLV